MQATAEEDNLSEWVTAALSDCARAVVPACCGGWSAVRNTAPSLYTKLQQAHGPALLRAARDGSLRDVVNLIDLGADVNFRGKLPESEDAAGGIWSALMCAAACGHDDVVRVLLYRSADPLLEECGDSGKRQPLTGGGSSSLGSLTDGLGNRRRLADAGLEQVDCGRSALTMAARECHPLVVRTLLDTRVDPNRGESRHGMTPLMFVALRKRASAAEVCHLLVASGACVDQRSTRGETALMMAARYGRVEMVKALCQLGADVAARNDEGEDALEQARNGLGEEDTVRGRGLPPPRVVHMAVVTVLKQVLAHETCCISGMGDSWRVLAL